MDYIIYNASGEILQVGNVPEEAFHLQAQEGQFILQGSADPEKDSIDVNTKTIIKDGKPIVTPVTPPVGYAAARRAMYPNPAEQLDLLWHAMDTGQIPKAQPFFDIIKSVKDSNPKPASGSITELN